MLHKHLWGPGGSSLKCCPGARPALVSSYHNTWPASSCTASVRRQQTWPGSRGCRWQAASQELEAEASPISQADVHGISVDLGMHAEPVSICKAEARKARRVPPTPIPPPALPQGTEALRAAFSNGVLLIDKPQDWTSFDVCGKLRNTLKFLQIKKVGHAGTLDPMATGLLIVATGAGTKFCDDFMAQEKAYSGVIRLGEGTNTYDAEAEVSERLPWEHITDADLTAAAARFLGDIQQVPPMYSAIKVKGQKLYDLAREGTVIEREARPVTIKTFKVWREPGPSDASPGGQAPPATTNGTDSAAGSHWLSKLTVQAGQWLKFGAPNQQQGSTPAAGPQRSQDVHFYVECSKGTYIRSLAYDLGRSLGTVAHLTALRREAIGDMQVGQAWQLQELLQQLYAAREAQPASTK